MFSKAIVRIPCPGITYGLTSSNLGKPEYNTALKQHSKYIELLKFLGLEVKVLPANDNFPDSTFIEDVALCTTECAIIMNPGAVSRRNETAGMRKVLGEFYSNIEEILLPATIEAGDIMMVGTHFYIGLSNRTNEAGADQLIRILGKYNMTGSKVRLEKMLHLKSGLSYLENNNLIVSGEFIDNKVFETFNRIKADENESYAANSLWINGKVIVPSGFPETRRRIEKEGYETIAVDVSEFRKVDGGLSCLSLRF